MGGSLRSWCIGVLAVLAVLVALAAGCGGDDGVPPGDGYMDPVADCTENSNTTVDFCPTDTDIVLATPWRGEDGFVYVDVACDTAIPDSPGERDLRYSCSVLPEGRNDSFLIACSWNAASMTWQVSAESGLPAMPRELKEGEGCTFADGKARFCFDPEFEVKEFGCSATETFGIGERAFDKTSNQPFPPP